MEFIVPFSESCDHQYRGLGNRGNQAGGFATVHVGQSQIKGDQYRVQPFDCGHAFMCCFAGMDVEAGTREDQCDEVADVSIVFDDDAGSL